MVSLHSVEIRFCELATQTKMKPKDQYKILVVDDTPQDVRVILDSLSQTYSPL